MFLLYPWLDPGRAQRGTMVRNSGPPPVLFDLCYLPPSVREFHFFVLLLLPWSEKRLFYVKSQCKFTPFTMGGGKAPGETTPFDDIETVHSEATGPAASASASGAGGRRVESSHSDH